MARLIDSDKLLQHFYEKEYADMYYIEVVKRIINEQPTVSTDEVRGVGKWEQKEIINLEDTTIEQVQSAYCSVCGKYHTTPFSYYFTEYNYCPDCGARMEVSEDARD